MMDVVSTLGMVFQDGWIDTLLGGDWVPSIWHVPRNIGNVIIPIDEL